MRNTTTPPMGGARASVLVGALAAALLLGSVAPSEAVTITVNSTADQALGAGGVCPGTPCTLRAAIQFANSNAGVDTIVLSPLFYALTITGAGEDAGATGDLDVNESVIIQISGAGSAIVFGTGSDRVFHFRSGASTMDKVTVWGGTVTDTPGAGILIDGAAALTYSNSTVTFNSGAGTTSTGGGIAVGTESSGNATLILNTVSVTNNTASNLGGGVWVGPNSSATITNCTFSGNSAAHGGGLYVRAGSSSSTQVINSTLNDNTASGNGGGANNGVCGNLIVRNSTIAGNSAGGNGGGLFNDITYICTTNLTVNNVTLAYNRAGTSGTGSGGGVFTAQSGILVGLTMVGNSILAWNEDLDSVNTAFSPDCTGRFDSKGHNLVYDQSGCNIVGSTVGNLPPFSNPNMGILRNNGGPTNTIALYVGSDAIDHGNAFGGAGPYVCEPADQRGVTRPVGSFCDMGAFEAPVCGNFVAEAPEDCDQGPTGGSSCDEFCRFLDPPPTHNEPKSAEKTSGYLVTAYQQCSAGNLHTLTPPTPTQTACAAARSDSLCSFNSSGTPITGTYMIDPLLSGDVRVKVDLKDISCNGQVLTVVASFRETVQNCPSGSGIGSCTISESLTKDLTIGTCTVTGGNCLVDVNLNSVPTLPHVQAGRRTGLEIQSIVVKRGSLVSFVPGVLIP